MTIAAGAFRGGVNALLRAEDFAHFRDQLRPLYEELVGTARFETAEEWHHVEVEGDGKGHFTARCVALDDPGMGNRLTFVIRLDQTDLPAILQDLDAICEEFPIR